MDSSYAIRVEPGGLIVVDVVTETPVDENDFRAYLDELLRLARAQPKFGVLFVQRYAIQLPNKYQVMQADWNRAHSDELRDAWRGMAIVTAGAFVAPATSINWMHPPPCRVQLFSNVAEARAWLQSQMTRSQEGATNG